MNQVRNKLQLILSTIESLPIETLNRYPELERTIPCLYDALQIDDVCDHKFTDGVCICGFTQNQK